MSADEYARKSIKELGVVSSQTPNEILAWATFMGNKPISMVRQSGPESLQDRDFWEKAYFYNGKIQRKYHDTKRERLRKSLLEKDIIRQKGLTQKNRKSGPRPKKYSFNVKWLGELLHTANKVNLNVNEAETLVAIEKLYSTEMVRKLLSPGSNLIKNHETGEKFSIKDLLFRKEISPADVRSIYSHAVINLPLMILVGRYIENSKRCKVDIEYLPSYLKNLAKRGVDINIRLNERTIPEEDLNWSKQKIGMALDTESDIRNFGESFEKISREIVTDNSIEIIDDLTETLIPSYISAIINLQMSKERIYAKMKQISQKENVNINVDTRFIEASQNIILNKTDLGEELSPKAT